jgi:hypothetical protein
MAVTEEKMEIGWGHVDPTGLDRLVISRMAGLKRAGSTENAGECAGDRTGEVHNHEHGACKIGRKAPHYLCDGLDAAGRSPDDKYVPPTHLHSVAKYPSYPVSEWRANLNPDYIA